MKLTVQTKLISGFIATLLLLLGVGAIGYLNMNTINKGGIALYQ